MANFGGTRPNHEKAGGPSPSSLENWKDLLGDFEVQTINSDQLAHQYNSIFQEHDLPAGDARSKQSNFMLATRTIALHRAAFGLNTVANAATDFISQSLEELNNFLYSISHTSITYPIRIDIIDQPDHIRDEARVLTENKS